LIKTIGIQPIGVKSASLTTEFDAEDAYLSYRWSYFTYFRKKAINLHGIEFAKK